MTNIHSHGITSFQNNGSSLRQSTNPLALARRNAGLLVALLYLQDIFWLLVSRVTMSYYEPMYQVSPLEIPLALLFIFISVFFAGIGLAATKLMRPLRKIVVPRWVIPTIIILATCLNILVAGMLASNARYVSGSLTGTAGIIYGLSQAASLASMTLLIKAQKRGAPLSRILLLVFTGSLVLIIDGLATTLMIGMFALIILDIRILRLRRAVVLAALAVGLLWIGFNAKFSQIPDYLTSEFMVRWVVARFSIQAEQMYTFLAGNSIIGDTVSYLDLVFRAISDRFDLVMGRPLMLEYPRSIAEATYFDMMGVFDAGSSPGALLSTTLQGPFFFIVIIIFAFIFLQYFYGIREKITLLQLFAHSFIFKSLHANFSEFLTIISPTLLIVVVFLLACLIVPRQNTKYSVRELGADHE